MQPFDSRNSSLARETVQAPRCRRKSARAKRSLLASRPTSLSEQLPSKDEAAALRLELDELEEARRELRVLLVPVRVPLHRELLQLLALLLLRELPHLLARQFRTLLIQVHIILEVSH